MPEVADLYLTLRVVEGQAVSGLAAVGAEGDRCAAQLKAVEASTAQLGARLNAVGAEADRAGAGLKIAGDGAKTSAAAMDESSAASDGLLTKLSGFGKTGALAVGAIGIASLDMATKFDAATTRLVTQAGVSQDKLAGLRSGVLDLAGQVGFSPDSLAESLYHVASNMATMGATSQQMLQVVKVAAEGAAVGGASLVDVTNALTAAVASGIPGVQDYSQAMGVLNATVGAGDMTMQDLADAFGSGMVATVKGFGLSITDVGAALAVFGDNNIRGAQAGTDLRMSVQALASPVKTAASTLQELGLTQSSLAQDMQKGGLKLALEDLKSRFEQAGVAADQQGQVITDLFGKKAGAGLQVLMDQMDRLESKYPALQAGASGFAGSWQQASQTLSQQFKDIEYGAEAMGIRIGEVLIPYVSRAITEVERVGSEGVKLLVGAWDIYGPSVEKKLTGASAQVKQGMDALAAPAKAMALDTLPILASAADTVQKAFGNLSKAIGPVVGGLGDLFKSLGSSNGALDVLAGRLNVGLGLLGDVTGVLGPIGEAVGGLAKAFGGLPGPIQLSVLSMLALRPFRPQIKGMQDDVVGFGRAGVQAFRGVGDAVLYQQVLAAGASKDIGKFGAGIAALEAQVPLLGKMGDAFRGVYQTLPANAGSAEKFGAALKGIGSAGAVGALAGLKGAASGLLDVMGGPWGLAIGAATTLIDYFAQKDAAAKQAVSEFTDVIRQDSGALGDNTRALVAQKLEQSGALDTARRYGISLSLVTDAALGNADAQAQVNAALQANATHQDIVSKGQLDTGRSTTELNKDTKALTDGIGDNSGAVQKAAQSYRDQQEALGKTASATTSATGPTSLLSQALKTLSDSASSANDKANALELALQQLSGGSVDYQAAVAGQNGAVIALNQAWQAGIDKAKGYGSGLLDASGKLNTMTENGQALFGKFKDLSQQTSTATQATYDYARAAGSSVPDALKTAEKSMQTSRDALIHTAEQFGLTADQAAGLADQMGLIPTNLPITLGLEGQDKTQAGLLYVQSLGDKLMKGTTIPVDALTDKAIADLKSVGLNVKSLDGKNLEITASSQQALKTFEDIDAIQLADKYFNIIPIQLPPQAGQSRLNGNADGGIISTYADGGVAHFANGGVLAAANGATVPGYAPRRDVVPAMLSPGEGVLVPEAVRQLGGASVISSINQRARFGPAPSANVLTPAAPAASAYAGPAGPQVIVNITVEGSIHSEKDLRDLMQREMLRLGMTNSQTWQSYGRH